MVEGPTCRFINFDMASNKGTWSNFVFRDVWFEKLGCPDGAGLAGSPLNNYLVIGGSLRQFTFDNVFIGAKKVMSLADLGPSKKQNVQESTFVYR